MSNNGKQSYDEIDIQNGSKSLKIKSAEELNNIALKIIKNIKDAIENIFLMDEE